jgi:hypothetical protein
MFKVGGYIKRKGISNKHHHHCIIVGEDEDNYTLYNSSLNRMQTVAKVVVNGMYTPVYVSG